MATIKRSEEMEAWQIARAICITIFELFKRPGFNKDFELQRQMNHSSGSVMDNIADGFERDGSREFIQFPAVAKGSSAEFRSQLYRTLDRKYISDAEFHDLHTRSEIRGNKMAGMMHYMRKSDCRGIRFMEGIECCNGESHAYHVNGNHPGFTK